MLHWKGPSQFLIFKFFKSKVYQLHNHSSILLFCDETHLPWIKRPSTIWETQEAPEVAQRSITTLKLSGLAAPEAQKRKKKITFVPINTMHQTNFCFSHWSFPACTLSTPTISYSKRKCNYAEMCSQLADLKKNEKRTMQKRKTMTKCPQLLDFFVPSLFFFCMWIYILSLWSTSWKSLINFRKLKLKRETFRACLPVNAVTEVVNCGSILASHHHIPFIMEWCTWQWVEQQQKPRRGKEKHTYNWIVNAD